jgi:predicted phosphodiesterase
MRWQGTSTEQLFHFSSCHSLSHWCFLLAVAGDEDLADAAIKLLNLNLTPGMETYDHSNFEVRAQKILVVHGRAHEVVRP